MKLAQFPVVIQQIFLRKKHESKAEYSIALAHLLNEIHEVCFKLDPKAPQTKKANSYNSSDVIDFLSTNQFIDAEILESIKDLFSRRNKLPNVHPENWGVEKNEYEKYKKAVGACLKALLR